MRRASVERRAVVRLVPRLAPLLAALSAAPTAASPAQPAPFALVGAWSEAERAGVAALLARVPDAVLARLPRTVARDATRCDADGWPDDDALVDARGGAHLCATAEPPAAVARRVVTALLFGFDRAAAWSEDAAWRRLSGWHAGLTSPRAANVSAAGFADARGRRSPRWDLTTFLAALWLDAPDASGGIACRLMSQAAFARARLAALSGADVPAPACRAFEGWADLDRLADVEVVLAAPSTAMVGSLFGHVFLRLVYRDDDGESPAHLSRTVAFLADNDVPFQADRGYAWKGIAGVYTASLHERSFLEAYREYVVTEGRDLRRWRLALTPVERAALMTRLWTVLRGGEYPYYFFRQNCATLMMDLVNEALAPERAVARAGLLAAPPASTLEAWAAARGADGAPLLQHVAAPVLSFEHEARVRSRHRAELEPRLVAAAPAELVAALSRALGEARAGEPARRAEAYERLATLFADPRVGGAADVSAWLNDGAAIESHLSIVANLQAEARADVERRTRARAARDEVAARLAGEAATRGDGALADAVARVGDDEADRRMEGYRGLRAVVDARARPPALVARVRLLALLTSEVRFDVARLKREPALRDALLFEDPDRAIVEQPYVEGHAELVSPPIVTRVAPPLRALQRAKQAAFAARALPAAPDDVAARAVATRAGYDASLSRSGIDQVAVTGGVLATSAGAVPGVVVGGALYDERLGDHRRFGFPADTAFVVARSDVWLGQGATGARLPLVLAYEARAFGYRSLRAPLPEAGTGRWTPGWELYLDLRGARARALATEVEAGWGVLVPVAARGELADHLLASLGVAYAGAFPTAAAPTGDKPQAAALPLALELRAALGPRPTHRSWLAARVLCEPRVILAGAARRVALTTAASAEAHLALRGRAPDGAHDPAFLVRVQALRSTLSLAGPGADTQVLVDLGVELR